MLTLIATPIGNLSDFSERAKTELSEADIILCEDTRKTGRLFQLLNLKRKGKLISCYEEKEKKITTYIVSLVKSNPSLKVVLVSDAGTPTISDPGYLMVNAFWENGLNVSICPGPCAFLSALAISGFPAHQFVFRGFPPNKAEKRKKFYRESAFIPWTNIFYESPKRLESSLKDLFEVLGNREVALVFELTKKHEEVKKGMLSDLLNEIENQTLKGECVVLVKSQTI
jgi:16S rRNA (cytidine1402-2'-O)-methyltransferase